MGLIVIGAYIEKLRKSTKSVVLVASKERNAQSEIALRKRATNYAIIVLHFPAIHFSKVTNA